MPARSTSAPSSGANAVLRLNFTVFGSTTVTESTELRSPVRWEPLVVLYRSMFHLTESASNAVPSWNLTSVRSVNVTVLPSLDVSHLSASHPMMSPFGVTRTSESYIAYMMFRSTNRLESIGSRLLTSFSTPNVIEPPYVAFVPALGDALPPPAGCCPPEQAARGASNAPRNATK